MKEQESFLTVTTQNTNDCGTEGLGQNVFAPKLVPPTHVCALIFMNSATARMVFVVCAANSRVGESMRLCGLHHSGCLRARVINRQVSSQLWQENHHHSMHHEKTTLRCRRTHSLSCGSKSWASEMAIMDVFPVPDCACAMTSRPCTMGRIALC